MATAVPDQKRAKWSGRRSGRVTERAEGAAEGRDAEEARHAAEEARHATIDSVAATADALHTTLEQMKFLEEARRIMRDLQDIKPPHTTN